MNREKVLSLLKQIFKNRSRLAIFIVLVIVIGLAGWRVLSGRGQQPQIQTVKVERGTIVSTISASGQILVANIVNITTSAKGLVKKVYVQDEDRVTLGQKILEMTLDSDAQQKAVSAYSSYLSAKNSLDSAQVSLYTLDSAMWAAQRKFINDAVSRSLTIDDPTYIQENDDWLAAEAKYKNQQNVIAQAQTALSSAWLSYQAVSSIVYAPMSGIITNITYVEGMTISTSDDTGQTVAVIKSEGTPLGSFSLSEIDVSQVKTGQKATITLDSIADKTFTGKVVSVDRIGTVTSGVTTYPVIIRFDTGSEQILPNMTATAEIIIEAKENVLWVPPQAVKQQAGQTYVRVLVNGKVQEKQVEMGLETSSQAEISSGLSEGETVVVSEITAGEETTFGGGGGMRGIMPGGGFEGRR